MVLHKTKQFVLKGEIGAEMEADVFCSAVLEPIVEFLVIAEVESFLLKIPLETPVSLSNKQEARVLTLMVEITSTQYSVAGTCPARLPQVR